TMIVSPKCITSRIHLQIQNNEARLVLRFALGQTGRSPGDQNASGSHLRSMIMPVQNTRPFRDDVDRERYRTTPGHLESLLTFDRARDIRRVREHDSRARVTPRLRELCATRLDEIERTRHRRIRERDDVKLITPEIEDPAPWLLEKVKLVIGVTRKRAERREDSAP